MRNEKHCILMSFYQTVLENIVLFQTIKKTITLIFCLLFALAHRFGPINVNLLI